MNQNSKVLLLLTFVFAFGSKSYCQSNQENMTPGQLKQENLDYSFRLFQLTDKTWCYDIYKKDKLFIHQTSIPGLPGNSGFEKKTDAEKVAMLVIEKMKKGETLPIITREELKKLKVL